MLLMRLIRPVARASVLLCAFAVLLAAGGSALAGLGQPTPWQMGFQQSAAPSMDDITWFHNFVLWIIVAITVFVLALLVIVMVKFNARANPTPSRTTITPCSRSPDRDPGGHPGGDRDPVVPHPVRAAQHPAGRPDHQATGNQWNWTYTYPDEKIEFPSFMLTEAARTKLNPPPPRLLAVDNAVYVPVNKVVRVQVIGSDVIHAFAVPSFGIKIDAIPGRLNETWFKATREGVYYGQCSELCGKDHAFMPIAVRVVNDQEFASWVEGAKKKFATNPSNSLASAGAAAQ